MTLIAPLVAVGLMLVAADFCARLMDARAARPAGRLPRLRQLWAVATTGLIAAYATQEALEGAMSPGHPGGVAGVVGHGGWAALPLAVAFGLAVALLARAGQRAIELAAEPPVRVVRPRPLVSLGTPEARRRLAARRTTRPLGARGPPLVSTP
jgi:hypothetical protein